MGVFRRRLGDIGLSSYGIIAVRCGTAAVFFALFMLAKNPCEFKIRIKDFWLFIGSGIFSLLFFTACYFQAMTLMSLSAAAVLLYTAPIFVIIISAVLFKEKITKTKIVAMILAFAGCCLVSGIAGGKADVTAAGILYGVGSGVGYALYSIFSKLAIQRGYTSNTINFYSCALAFLGAGIIWGFKEPVDLMIQSGTNLLFCLLTGFVTCFLPYALYVFGLTGVEAGRASIMVSVEPVVATAAGLIFFGETPDFFAVAGMVLVLAAIILLNVQTKPKKERNFNGR